MDNIRLKILCFIAVVLYTVSAFSQFAVDNNVKYRIDKETKTASIVGLYDKKIKSQYDLNIPKYIEVGSVVYEVISIEDRAFYGDYNLKSVSFVEDTANIANSYQEILFDFTNSLSPFTNYTTSGEGEWINAYSTAKADGYDNATQKTIAGTYYLVSPAISLAEFSNAYVDYSYILRYNCDDGNQQLLISTSFDSRVPNAGWKVLNQSHTEGTDWTTFSNTEVQIPDEYMGRTIYLAFRYNADNKSSSTWEIKSLKVSDGNDDEDKQSVSSIENGGFEIWTDGKPNNWSTTSVAGNATLSKSYTAHSGNYSVCVAGTTSANKRLAYKEIYLEAGTYTMTFYAKAESSVASVRPGYVPVTNGAVGTYVYGEYTNEITANGWVKVIHEFTIEKKTNLSLVIMNSKNPGGNVLIDDVTLTKHPSMSSLNENQGNYGYIGESAFENCSSLISVEIPNGVTSIGTNAFFQCHRLTSVTIPSSVVSIENGAFSSCNRLTSLEIPNGVTSIGEIAFASCSSLTSVSIPNSVTNIGWAAFYHCNNVSYIYWDTNVSPSCLTQYCNKTLNTIVLGDKMTIIGNSAFYGCSGLTSIEIPNTVIYIGDDAFSGCSNLTSLNIPNNVTDIGDYAFSGCSSLTSLKLPNTVTSIGGSAFRDCSGLKNINIPDLVTNIGSYTFYNCCSLTSIDIPNSVDTIGEYAFYNCNSLNSITIPNDVDSIVDYTFSGCNGLKNINIGTSVKYISPTAFENCGSIDNVYVNMPKPISVDTKAFDAIRLDGWYLAVLYVPIGTKDMYQLISPWKYFYKIVECDVAGIENVKIDAPKGEKVYYNLNGQRVNNPTNGIYILNGKKVLVK